MDSGLPQPAKTPAIRQGAVRAWVLLRILAALASVTAVALGAYLIGALAAPRVFSISEGFPFVGLLVGTAAAAVILTAAAYAMLAWMRRTEP